MKTYSPRVLAFLAKENSILSRVLQQVQTEKKKPTSKQSKKNNFASRPRFA